MNVKAVLESHAKLKAKIRFTVKEIEDMRGLAENVISNVSESKRAELVGKALDIDKRLTEEYDSYVALQAKISDMIDTVDNESELIALKCVYILHYSNEQTAKEMGYTVRHIARLLKSGLEKLQTKYNDADINDIEI
jgi:hypothetical protein